MEKIEGGSVYFKAMPRCPVHGKMRLRGTPPSLLWTCAGWDGEGCGHEVDGSDIPWEYIGEAASMRFQFPLS